MNMPQYRIYLSEGRQIDLEATTHKAHNTGTGKFSIGRVDFFDDNSNVVASFSADALHGFTKTDNLVLQKNTPAG